MVAKLDFDIKQEYFNHLVDMVVDKRHPKVDYIPLLDLLHSLKFEWSIDMDENRASDGAFLRDKWLDSEGLYSYKYEFEDEKVSVLEVLIGIAERFEYQVGNIMDGDHISERFWEILRNLDVEKYSAGNYKPLNIKEKVRNWMLRRYKRDGSGSIFPVKKCEKDMREMQIWDQMSFYIMENYE
jgi:hypothetical protein